MTEHDIAYKYVHGLHDALTDSQEKTDMANDIINFAKEYHKKQLLIHSVRLSLPDAKQAVAEMYSKKDWQDVLRDYEYGIGISKMIGFEDLMDKVAEVYKSNEA